MTEAQLDGIWEFCRGNRELLIVSDTAGCFFCRTLYRASEVTEYVREEECAVCPNCGIDSVLPSCAVELSLPLLNEMNAAYFQRHVK